MPDITLRPATQADAESCAAILRDWINATDWLPNLHTPEEDIAFVLGLIGDEDVTVAERNGEIAGFLSCGDAEISCLYVRENHRSQGVGTALIRDATATATHLTLWTFQANTGARRFYAQHGFNEVELTDGSRNEEKIPDVRLEWHG